jgi:hypothetical protein
MFQCKYKKCQQLYSQEYDACPYCSTKKGAKKPPFILWWERFIVFIMISAIMMIIMLFLIQLNQYCDPMTGNCGIGAYVSALQATPTANATETTQANMRATERFYVTATERVQQSLTEFVHNRSIAMTNIATTRTAAPTLTARANDVNATMTYQANIIRQLNSDNSRMRSTSTAIAMIPTTRPNHFIADGVNQIAYTTYDSLQLPHFIEDIVIIFAVFCAGTLILGLFIGAIAVLNDVISNN